jgi:hypothetical protein
MYVLRNVEAFSPTHCCYGKAISITYSECVFAALVVLHSKLVYLWLVSAVYFSTFSHKR